MMPPVLGGTSVSRGDSRPAKALAWFGRTPAWPLLLLLFAFPLWWILGFGSLGFLIVGALLFYQLLKLPTISVPPGFVFWALFLGVATLGVFVLWVPVPGLMPESGSSRILSWAFRLIWLIASTAVMLYIGNSSRKLLPDKALICGLGAMFIFTVIGGYAGIFFGRVDFPSLLEAVLPHSVATNNFLASQIHPGLAQVQDILGYDSARPKAPFEYANSWGANFGLLLPFYLLSFRYAKLKIVKLALWCGLLASIPPAVLSLNRAMWIGLAAIGLLAIIRLAISGRLMALGITVFSLVTATMVFIATPLWNVIETRLANPHSNTGRTNLAEYTILTALEHSPIIGFGSTRTRQGNFFSIAAGATADCHQCNPPQLGTQGTLWFLIFCTGFLGTILFLAYFIRHFTPVLVAKDPIQRAMIYPSVFFACVLPTYDTITTSLFILMIAVGISWRRTAVPIDAPSSRKGLKI